MKTVLSSFWEQFNEHVKQGVKGLPAVYQEEFIASLFSVGATYFYTINSSSIVTKCTDSLLTTHGLKSKPKHLKDLADLVHTEDLTFLMDAEAWLIDKMLLAKSRKQLFFKGGYCFRMKLANGSYELFQHEVIFNISDKIPNSHEVLTIHTNVNHIATTPNFKVFASEFGPHAKTYECQLDFERLQIDGTSRLSKRELEVFLLVVKGLSDREIAETLFLSHHTVRTHHKNILKKTKTKNSKELIKQTLEKRFGI